MTWALTGEQLAIRAEARTLAREVVAPRAAVVDRREEYPWENVAALQEAGFTGMTVPVELAGPGRPLLDAVLVVEVPPRPGRPRRTARRSTSAASATRTPRSPPSESTIPP